VKPSKERRRVSDRWEDCVKHVVEKVEPDFQWMIAVVSWENGEKFVWRYGHDYQTN